ncbi:MAG: RagB/SusD family nutrient uptake outer membrane protein [marine benthic group bacterium]|nr:RagB/SusD family nutrient uptake outer membrane protein [Gemmatimonadota bacterium]
MTTRIRNLMALCGAIAVLGGVAACDVTTEPKSTVTDANIFNDAQSYEALLAKLYAGLSVTGQQGPSGNSDFQRLDEGFSHYGRQLWQLQELPTDEAVIAWNDAGLPELSTQGWASSNQFVQMMYSRIFYQVSLANEFLRESTPEKLTERGQESLIPEVQQFRAEARFLRALSYWHGIDLFGDIPLVDESFPLGSTPPEQSTRQEIYNFVVNELNEIRTDLPPSGAGEYGRADQGAASMLLAKLYMNSGVYIGSDAYASALPEIENVIAGYQLEPDFWTNFRADNGISREIVFAVPQDGDNTQTWGGTTFLVHAGVGGDMPASDWGIDGGWWGLRTTPEFVNLFPGGAETTDGRVEFWTEGHSLEVNSITDFFSGYPVPKYTNLNSAGAQGSHPTFPDTDYPMFRLADAFLMYAEVVARGGGGSLPQAVGYVNALRERAYGGPGQNIGPDDLTLDFILDERARELYWEGHRRTDLIRFGVFTGGERLWSWKGNVQSGQSTPDHLDLYPIPASEILANPNLIQNPGY